MSKILQYLKETFEDVAVNRLSSDLAWPLLAFMVIVELVVFVYLTHSLHGFLNIFHLFMEENFDEFELPLSQELQIARRKSQWRNRLERYNRMVNRKVSRIIATEEGKDNATMTNERSKSKNSDVDVDSNRSLRSKYPMHEVNFKQSEA